MLKAYFEGVNLDQSTNSPILTMSILFILILFSKLHYSLVLGAVSPLLSIYRAALLNRNYKVLQNPFSCLCQRSPSNSRQFAQLVYRQSSLQTLTISGNSSAKQYFWPSRSFSARNSPISRLSFSFFGFIAKNLHWSTRMAETSAAWMDAVHTTFDTVGMILPLLSIYIQSGLKSMET